MTPIDLSGLRANSTKGGEGDQVPLSDVRATTAEYELMLESLRTQLQAALDEALTWKSDAGRYFLALQQIATGAGEYKAIARAALHPEPLGEGGGL